MNLTIRNPRYYLGYDLNDKNGTPYVLVLETESGSTVKNFHFPNKESAVLFTQKNAVSVTVTRG